VDSVASLRWKSTAKVSYVLSDAEMIDRANVLHEIGTVGQITNSSLDTSKRSDCKIGILEAKESKIVKSRLPSAGVKVDTTGSDVLKAKVIKNTVSNSGVSGVTKTANVVKQGAPAYTKEAWYISLRKDRSLYKAWRDNNLNATMSSAKGKDEFKQVADECKLAQANSVTSKRDEVAKLLKGDELMVISQQKADRVVLY